MDIVTVSLHDRTALTAVEQEPGLVKDLVVHFMGETE